MINVIALIGGLVVPVIVYSRFDWWLNSGTGVLVQSALLFGVGFLATLVERRENPSLTWWFPAFSAAAGAIVSSMVILFWIGPGDIFPIVLAFVHVICAAATFAGAAVVILPRAWLKRRAAR